MSQPDPHPVDSAPRFETQWHVLARQAPVAAILDLDSGEVPLSTSSDETLDRALLLLFGALHGARVQVAVICRRPATLSAALRAQAPTVWWFEDRQAAIVEARQRLPGVHLVVIGGDGNLHELREGIDLGLAVRAKGAGPSRARIVLQGATAVRAMLWWLVTLRSGSAAAERRGCPP
jgi:hypothetical protein